MVCVCGGHYLGTGIRITGTRDGFGIGNEFVDEKTHKTIDNWKSWERAGYRKPLEAVKNHTIRERVKEKIQLMRGEKHRQPTPAEMPM